MADVARPRPKPVTPTIDLKIGPYFLTAATAFGPRLVGLRRQNGPQILAQLGDEVVVEHSNSGTYRFHGGHRLWAAPEVPSITYASDDHACVVTSGADRLTITAPVDAAGLIKELRVSLESQRLVIDHQLMNAGLEPMSIAAWGITQLRLGGVALVPFGSPPFPDEFQADRSLVLWPYTDLADPRLRWLERAAAVEAVAGPRLKIGSGPSPGRLGYLIDGHLFTKEITPAGAGVYTDRGAVGQVFVEGWFCELESVGPLSSLQPGSSISHREVWEITRCADLTTAYRHVLGEPTP
jgi:hypothetical protein